MKVDFRRLTWENYPSTETPINADNLNRLEEGVAGLYSDVHDIEQELGGGVGEYVADWLNEHVDPAGSAVVVDDTLTIEGAAADAKKAGDEISSLKEDLSENVGDLKNAFDDVYKEIGGVKNDLYNTDKSIPQATLLKTSGYTFDANGDPTADATWSLSDYLLVSELTTVTGFANNNRPAIVYYDAAKIKNGKEMNTTGTSAFITKTSFPSDAIYLRVASCQGINKIASGTVKTLYDMNVVIPTMQSEIDEIDNRLVYPVNIPIFLLTRNKDYIFDTNGALSSEANWYVSDYILVAELQEVYAYAQNNRPGIVYYAADKSTIIDKVVNTSGSIGYVHATTFPEGAIYARIVSCYGLNKYAYGTMRINKTNDYGVIPNDVLMYRTGFTFNASSEESSDATWTLSDYIPIEEIVDISGFANNNRPGIVYYNSSKNIVGNELNSSGSSAFVRVNTIPANTAYLRVSSCQGINKYAEGVWRTKADKEPYTDRFIYFTVSVNTTKPTTSTGSSVGETQNKNYVWCALKLPKTYSEVGAKTKLAVCMHGAGGLIYDGYENELHQFQKLVDEGYAIMDCAGVPGDVSTSGSAQHMGGLIALESYKKAIDYVIEHYNVTNKIYLHGHSMGGLTALNFANLYGDMVVAIGLFYPVTDLYNQAWLHPWFDTTKSAIVNAYDFTSVETYDSDKVIGFNPIENNSVVVGDDRYNFMDCPVRVWHGDEDTTVSLEGSQAFIEALRNGGCYATLRELDGVGHTDTATMYTELLYWFNRF